jgi:hypothetical protein
MMVREIMRFPDEPHPADPGYEPESATLPEGGEGFDLLRHLLRSKRVFAFLTAAAFCAGAKAAACH